LRKWEQSNTAEACHTVVCEWLYPRAIDSGVRFWSDLSVERSVQRRGSLVMKSARRWGNSVVGSGNARWRASLAGSRMPPPRVLASMLQASWHNAQRMFSGKQASRDAHVGGSKEDWQ
jgi:hypothetical protein